MLAEGIFREADCMIFSCQVSDEEYHRMRNKIRQIERCKEQYKYNFIGLFGVAFNIGIQRNHAFFCSQFVATVVNEGGVPMFTIKPNLVQPHHFTKVPFLIQEFEGNLRTYLHLIKEVGKSSNLSELVCGKVWLSDYSLNNEIQYTTKEQFSLRGEDALFYF